MDGAYVTRMEDVLDLCAKEPASQLVVGLGYAENERFRPSFGSRAASRDPFSVHYRKWLHIGVFWRQAICLYAVT